MWTRLKTAVLGISEQLGVEVPELPVDLGPLTDTISSAADSVGTVTTDATVAVAEAADGAAPALTDAAGAVVDQASTIPGVSTLEGLTGSR
jgi:hypothetical protein